MTTASRSGRRGPALPMTKRQFGERLASELTLVATAAELAGRICSPLKGADHIDMLYVHPSASRAGRGVDAVRRAGKARGRPRREKTDGRSQRQRRTIFTKRGYVANQRNTVTVNGEWLANTTMQKSFTSDAPKGATQ